MKTTKKSKIERYGQDNRLLLVPVAMLFAMLALFASIASYILFVPLSGGPVPTVPALVAPLSLTRYDVYVPVVLHQQHIVYVPLVANLVANLASIGRGVSP